MMYKNKTKNFLTIFFMFIAGTHNIYTSSKEDATSELLWTLKRSFLNTTDYERMEKTINEFNIDVNSKDNNGNTALHLVASKRNRDQGLEFCKFLLKNGADINAENAQRCTPLKIAIFSTDFITLDEPDTSNVNFFSTADHIFFHNWLYRNNIIDRLNRCKSSNMIIFFFKNGANLCKQDSTSLLTQASKEKHNTEAIKLLFFLDPAKPLKEIAQYKEPTCCEYLTKLFFSIANQLKLKNEKQSQANKISNDKKMI